MAWHLACRLHRSSGYRSSFLSSHRCTYVTTGSTNPIHPMRFNWRTTWEKKSVRNRRNGMERMGRRGRGNRERKFTKKSISSYSSCSYMSILWNGFRFFSVEILLHELRKFQRKRRIAIPENKDMERRREMKEEKEMKIYHFFPFLFTLHAMEWPCLLSWNYSYWLRKFQKREVMKGMAIPSYENPFRLWSDQFFHVSSFLCLVWSYILYLNRIFIGITYISCHQVSNGWTTAPRKTKKNTSCSSVGEVTGKFQVVRFNRRSDISYPSWSDPTVDPPHLLVTHSSLL